MGQRGQLAYRITSHTGSGGKAARRPRSVYLPPRLGGKLPWWRVMEHPSLRAHVAPFRV